MFLLLSVLLRSRGLYTPRSGGVLLRPLGASRVFVFELRCDATGGLPLFFSLLFIFGLPIFGAFALPISYPIVLFYLFLLDFFNFSLRYIRRHDAISLRRRHTSLPSGTPDCLNYFSNSQVTRNPSEINTYDRHFHTYSLRRSLYFNEESQTLP